MEKARLLLKHPVPAFSIGEHEALAPSLGTWAGRAHLRVGATSQRQHCGAIEGAQSARGC